ncbi:MAG: hypothetical protein Q9157_007073 [Trypethelium eluteriae]
MKTQPDLASKVQKLELMGTKPKTPRTDVQYTKLISCCKNIKYLGLGWNFKGLPMELDRSFSLLREIRFQENRDYPGRRAVQGSYSTMLPALVHQIFRLPAIEELHISVPNTRLQPMTFGNLSQAPTLTSITLQGSHVDEEHIVMLLSSTPQLRKFDFDRDGDFVKYIRGPPSRLSPMKRLHQALLQVSRTLEDLKLALNWEIEGWHSHDGGWTLDSETPKGRLGSMKIFESLVRLDVPIVMLLGFSPAHDPSLGEVLPPNLRHLCIASDLCEWATYKWTARLFDDYLQGWVPHLRTYAPSLERFNLRVFTNFDRGKKAFWTERTPDHFCRLCIAAGLQWGIEFVGGYREIRNSLMVEEAGETLYQGVLEFRGHQRPL